MGSICTYCAQPAAKKFETKDFNQKVDCRNFHYFQCPSCRLIYMDPHPTNIETYYPSSYYSLPENLEKAEVEFEGLERFKINIVKEFIAKGSLLEIGPGTGGFAYLAGKEGFDVETMEVNPRFCRYLKETLHVPTIQSGNLSALPPDRSYDAIALWHVLEHLSDPWKTLEELTQRLKPGGFLFIAMPNPDSLQFRFFGKYWAHVDAPRHFQLIPQKLLEKSLNRHHCSLLWSTTNDAGGLHQNRFGWRVSIHHAIRIRYIRGLFSLLGPWLNRIMSPLESVDGKGCAYTHVYRKRMSTK